MKTSRNITKHVIDLIFFLIFSLSFASVVVFVLVVLAVVVAPQRKGLPFGSESDFLVFAIVAAAAASPDADRKLPFLRSVVVLLLSLDDEMMMIPQHMS